MPVNAVAVGACRIAMVPRDAFIDLALQHRSVHRHVMRVIGPVMRGMNAARVQPRAAPPRRHDGRGARARAQQPGRGRPRAAGRPDRGASRRSRTRSRRSSRTGIEREDAARLLVLQREAMERGAARGPARRVDASDAEDAMLDALEHLRVPSRGSRPSHSAPPGPTRTARRGLNAIAGDATPKALEWVAASLTARGARRTSRRSPPDRMSHLVRRSSPTRTWTAATSSIADVHQGLEKHADHARSQAQAHAHQGQVRLRQVAAEADACAAPN